MSTSPSRTMSGRGRRAASLLRVSLLATAIGAVASVASGIAIEPLPPPPPAAAITLSPLEPTTPTQPADQRAAGAPGVTAESPSPDPLDCSNPAARCEPGSAAPEPPAARALPETGCRLSGNHAPEGTSSAAPVTSPGKDQGRVLYFQVEIEDGLAIDQYCFASLIDSILNDPRGWASDGSVSFQQVVGQPDFRIILASPDTTNRLCYPLRTGGKYSCRSRTGVILNLMRWESGTEEYAGNLQTYREYLVNHEVGHLLGHGHVSCPGTGELAPVMMQQTKGLEGCLLNGWPTADER